MPVSDFKETICFKKAYELSMRIFVLSKQFPKEETYSLTDQIRQSSRSVCANISEAFRKKRYPLHFISKLTDCDAENAETQVWLSFAMDCEYISGDDYKPLKNLSLEVRKLIHHIISNPEKY